MTDVRTEKVGCSGSEVNVQEKEVNLAKSGLKFDVKVCHAANST